MLNKNKLDKDVGCGIRGCSIDKRIANLLNNMKKMSSGADFVISKARLTFTYLKKAFTKALILYHFNPERHIQIKTDTSSYAISGILN